MHPFVVNEETKTMVIDNIAYLLNNYIKCSEYKNIIFCWVMHEQSIIDDLLSRMNGDYQAYCISLTCTPEQLVEHLQKDIDHGIRNQSIIQNALARLSFYDQLHTYKIEVSNLTIAEVVKHIKEHIS